MSGESSQTRVLCANAFPCACLLPVAVRAEKRRDRKADSPLRQSRAEQQRGQKAKGKAEAGR